MSPVRTDRYRSKTMFFLELEMACGRSVQGQNSRNTLNKRIHYCSSKEEEFSPSNGV